MRGRKFETWTDAVEDRGLQRGLKQGLEQGLEQGIEQGIEQGREQGLALACERLRGILERALVKRYGTLPVGVAAQIEHAPMDELETLIDRAMDADSIDALFGPQAAQRQPQPPTFWAT
jgi:flagellar biosynthesis/type III secretory pathway protein FliH